MTLNLYKEKEVSISSLSGEFSAIPSSIWWQEKYYDERINETTKSFIDTEPLFTFLQSKNCNIINKEEITDFLSNNIYIINYLYEAPNVINKKFGDVNLNLELVFDPEIEGQDGELFLNIDTNLEVKEAREKLKEIDREWLIPIVGENIAKFNLNLDFI